MSTWSPEIIDDLKRNYAEEGPSAFARRYGLSRGAVCAKAHRLNLFCNYDTKRRPKSVVERRAAIERFAKDIGQPTPAPIKDPWAPRPRQRLDHGRPPAPIMVRQSTKQPARWRRRPPTTIEKRLAREFLVWREARA